jgi:hypothetical protein
MPSANLKSKSRPAPPPAQPDPEPTADLALAAQADAAIDAAEAEEAGEPMPDAAEPRVMPDGFPNPKAMDVWQYMEALTESQWSWHMVYLYRKDPKPAEDAATGEPAYLEKLTQPFTIDYVKEKWGGKRFYFFLNRRREAPQRGEVTIYKKYFRIDAPPKWGSKEQAGNALHAAGSSGATEDTLLREVVRDLIKQRDAAKNEGRTFDVDQALSQSVSILKQGSTAAIEMVQAQNKGGNNELVLLLLTKLFDRLDHAQSNPVMDQFMKAAMERMFTQPADPLEQLTKILNIAEQIKGARGGSRESAGWSEVASKLIDRAPEILQQGRALVDSAAARVVAPRSALPPGGGTGVTGGATVAPAPAVPTADLHTSANPGASPGPAPAVVDHIKATVVAMCLQGDDGGDAALMAELAVPEYAEQLYQSLKTDPMALATDPILGQCVRSPHLAQFLSDFVAHFEEADAEETEDAPVGVPN